MIREEILHTGSFNDYSGNVIKVEFYRREEVASLAVSPSSIRFGRSSSTSGVTATWYSGSEPTLSIEYTWGDPGWLTLHGSGSVSENTKSWGFTATSNDTLIERGAMLNITNGLDTIAVPVRQNR